MNNVFDTLSRRRFLFKQLVKRDFKKKYKRSILGMGWSMLYPLMMLLVMKFMFEQFFGRGIAHFTTYLFCGNLVYAWFSESTGVGMRSLMSNAGIFTKVNIPKYIFLLAGNVQTLINFGLTLVIFFILCAFDHITFTWRFALLLYPICTLMLMNIGIGLILSALYVFFGDIGYLWTIFLQIIMYCSAIFYPINTFSPKAQLVFAVNPVYRHIAYFREIVLNGTVPSLSAHLILLGCALVSLLIGGWIYHRYNTKFLYYV